MSSWRGDSDLFVGTMNVVAVGDDAESVIAGRGVDGEAGCGRRDIVVVEGK